MQSDTRTEAAIVEASTTPHFPIELQEMVIHSLSPEGEWPDATTLARCALTQKDWYPTATKSLYNRVEIWEKEKYRSLENVLRHTASPASALRVQALSVLDLTPAERISTTILHTPQRFSGLEQLFVLFGMREDPKENGTFPFRPSFLATLRQFRFVAHIYFYDLELDSLGELRKVLGSFPGLESAIFRSVTWKKSSPDFKPLFNATSWRLSHFNLSACTSNFVAPLFWAAPPPSCRKLQNLPCHPAVHHQDVVLLTELTGLVLNPLGSAVNDIRWEWEQDRESNEWCLECDIGPANFPRGPPFVRFQFRRYTLASVEGFINSISLSWGNQDVEMAELDACLCKFQHLCRLDLILIQPNSEDSVESVVQRLSGVLELGTQISVSGAKDNDNTPRNSRAKVICNPSIKNRIAKLGTLASQSHYRLSKALNKLYVRHTNLDHHDDALVVIQRIVLIQEDLAKERPTLFDRYLADSLHDLFVCLSKLDQWKEAYIAIQRVVSMRQVLAKKQPTTFNRSLADSLHDLFVCLSKLGKHEKALDAIQREISVRRVLARKQATSTFDQDIANALHNLWNTLCQDNRQAQALVAIQLEVYVREILAEEQPTIFKQALATSLHGLFEYLTRFHRQKAVEALIAIRREVVVQETLAQEDPAAFNIDLASSLHQLFFYLSGLGQHAEALVVLQREISVRESFAHNRPFVPTAPLSFALYALFFRLYKVGRYQEALDAVRHELAVYLVFAHMREISDSSPDTLHDLWISVSTDSNLPKQTLATVQREGSTPWRMRMDGLRDLPSVFTSLSICLSALGRHEEALDFIQCAVWMFGTFNRSQPFAYHEDLPGSLSHLSLSYTNLNRHEEALESAERFLHFYRDLARYRPRDYSKGVVRGLNNLSQCLAALGRDDEAEKAREEAISTKVDFEEEKWSSVVVQCSCRDHGRRSIK